MGRKVVSGRCSRWRLSCREAGFAKDGNNGSDIHGTGRRKNKKTRTVPEVCDLFWYLSDRAWPEPNLEYLHQALRQTQGPESPLKAKNWRQAIAARLNAIDWRQALADVRPFIERSEELDLLTLLNLKKLLG